MSFMKRIAVLFVLFALFHVAAANEPTLHQKSFSASAHLQTFALMQNLDDETISKAPQANHEKITKNKGKAFFMSLLLPGWGQHYAESKTKRAVFLGIEVGLWLSYAGFTTYGNWRQEDYETYAATHAGVNLEGKNNTYFIDVGNFASIYEHNAYRLQQRNFNKYYQDIDFYFWEWDSQQSRDAFDRLRISADTADNRALFVLGAIVANHIVSAIDAVWSVHRYEKSRLSTIDWDVRFGDGRIQPTVNVSFTAHF